MATDKITISYPSPDSTDSLQILLDPITHELVGGNDVNIENAFKCKDNTLTVIIYNTGEQDATATFRKGVYQNAVLGDLSVSVEAGKTVIVKVENPSRFEQADSSLTIGFSSGMVGNLLVFGKKAGLQ